MKRNVVLFALLLAHLPALAWAGVIADTHFNSLVEGGWECHAYLAAPEILKVSSSPDASSVLKINFPSGFADGTNPSSCTTTASFNSSEIYQQLYVYFPSGYQFHTVANKLSYDYLDTNNYAENPGNLYVAVFGSSRQVVIHLQPNSSGSPNRVLYPNKRSTTIQYDTWYKLTWYVKLNTSGSSNGIARIWINDVLESEYTDVNMRGGNWGTRNFTHSSILPIFGGLNKETKSGADYFYFDRAILSTTPISGGSAGALPIDPPLIEKEPMAPSEVTIK